jgi:hypothetical protein
MKKRILITFALLSIIFTFLSCTTDNEETNNGAEYINLKIESVNEQGTRTSITDTLGFIKARWMNNDMIYVSSNFTNEYNSRKDTTLSYYYSNKDNNDAIVNSNRDCYFRTLEKFKNWHFGTRTYAIYGGKCCKNFNINDSVFSYNIDISTQDGDINNIYKYDILYGFIEGNDGGSSTEMYHQMGAMHVIINNFKYNDFKAITIRNNTSSLKEGFIIDKAKVTFRNKNFSFSEKSSTDNITINKCYPIDNGNGIYIELITIPYTPEINSHQVTFILNGKQYRISKTKCNSNEHWTITLDYNNFN